MAIIMFSSSDGDKREIDKPSERLTREIVFVHASVVKGGF